MNDPSTQKDYLTTRAEFAHRSAIPLIGLAMVLTTGGSLFEDLQGLPDLSSASPLTCFSNVTFHRSTGRYTFMIVRHQNGKSLEACDLTDCKYLGWGLDAGKAAKMCFSGKTLASVEINGAAKLTREQQLSFLRERVLVSTGIFAMGVLCLLITAHKERFFIKA